MRMRITFFMGGVGLAVLAIVLAVSGLRGVGKTTQYVGTLIDPPMKAFDFSLVNQKGETVSLSDFRGEPIVLTFLYTSCTDVCPFVGIKLKLLSERLAKDFGDVNIVVITTDPERDTQERISEYSQSLGMFDDWHYMVGDEEQLAPIWDSYFVGRPTIAPESVFATREDLDFYGLTNGLDETQILDANTVRGQFGGGYDVGHVTPVWLINPQGEIVLKMDTAGTPEDYANNVRLLVETSQK